MPTDPAMHHAVYFHEDDEGFWYGECVCGWHSPPVPDKEDVADAYGDHRAEHAVAELSALHAPPSSGHDLF